MKKIIIMMLVMLIAVPVFSGTPKRMSDRPFAPKAKYGKLRTKQCKPVRERNAWIFNQFGRN